jgi:hypothetical protein
MRWREVQQIFVDADESATFTSRAVYKVFCLEDGGSKSPLHGAISQKTVIVTVTAMTT